jgi:hypothetical protein
VSDSLKFEVFHVGVKVYVPFLSRNRVTSIDRWSTLDETIRFLHSKEPTSQVDVLKQQVAAMSCVPVGQTVYHPEIMVRAFEYFATSRALYNRLKDDYKLPSVRTLTRVTSKVSKIHDANFIKRVFDALVEEKRHCILLFDEVYLKKMMSYHGGTVFGKALQ